MSTKTIYLILIPLGFVNIFFYYVWYYLMRDEPTLLQFTVLQVFVNAIAAGFIINQIKKDNFY